MAANLTNQVVSLTMSHYVGKLIDNIFTSKPWLYAVFKGGRVKNYHGTSIEVQLMYGKSPNRGSYSGSDVFATAAPSGIGNASFGWKQYYSLVTFEGLELAINSGREAVLSLLQSRLEQSELTISEELNEMLLGDGTGNGGKDWDGLKKLIGTIDNEVGGIDSTTATWWESVVNASAIADADLIARMRTAYNDASEGNDHPTNLLGTQAIYEIYEDSIQENQRFENTAMADAGFQNLMFKAAPFAFDEYVDAQHLYFVNLKYINLAKLNDVWFKASEMLTPTNQDVQYKHIKCYGNLVISNRKRHAALTNVTNG